MSHGQNPNGIVMKRADGKPMTREEVIIKRRGAFTWLPVFFSNDLVHGSWWMVFGSISCSLFAIYPLVAVKESKSDDILPATDYDVTWALLIVSGAFFTFGALAFVRAFEEPPKRPLFHNFRHLQTDELLGAWFFLWGTVPAIPYCLVFFILKPSFTYFVMLCLASVLVLGSLLFVIACYPNDKKVENYLLPLCLRVVGAQIWVVKHLANDWLAGTWFFLWANGLLTFGSMLLLFYAMGFGTEQQVFIWLSGTISSFFFLVGSLYYVSGSYPHAQQFYYALDRGRSNSNSGTSKLIGEDTLNSSSLDSNDKSSKDHGFALKPSIAISPALNSLALAPSHMIQSIMNPIHQSNPSSSYQPLYRRDVEVGQGPPEKQSQSNSQYPPSSSSVNTHLTPTQSNQIPSTHRGLNIPSSSLNANDNNNAMDHPESVPISPKKQLTVQKSPLDHPGSMNIGVSADRKGMEVSGNSSGNKKENNMESYSNTLVSVMDEEDDEEDEEDDEEEEDHIL